MINNMNSDLGKEQHSSTAAEALSLLLGIRYSKNQIFEKLKKQDCSIFHDNIKLTSNDLYISIGFIFYDTNMNIKKLIR